MRRVGEGGVLEGNAAFKVGDGKRANQRREGEGQQVLDSVYLLALSGSPFTTDGLLDMSKVVRQVSVVDGIIIVVVVIVIITVVVTVEGRSP